MHRDHSVARLRDSSLWDVLVIGGGATGLGAALDAASRGYRTALVEQGDFAQETSSRSTKLIHGGVRYLRQGNLRLVQEALLERSRLLANAPQIVKPLSFMIPVGSWWDAAFYGAGLKLYERLAGRKGLDGVRFLSRAKSLHEAPTLQPHGLRGSWLFQDGQFDDAALALALARTFEDLGGTAANYTQVISLRTKGHQISGAVVHDRETGQEWEIAARAVINATGVFCDTIRQMEDPDARRMVTPSQGTHVVLPARFLPGQTAVLIPRTEDGRVLFAIPWHGRVLLGTTDLPVPEPRSEPRPLPGEIEYLLDHAARFLTSAPRVGDVLSVFSGLRPLVRSDRSHPTALLPRDHTVSVSEGGLVTITGGKWTTYRRMGEDAVTYAARVGGLPARLSRTEKLRLLDGAAANSGPSDAALLHPSLPCSREDVIRGAREEMARTVADVLSRRTRALLLDAGASIEIAPCVASVLARELGRDPEWEQKQVEEYTALARGYLPV